jgi:hemoglobin
VVGESRQIPRSGCSVTSEEVTFFDKVGGAETFYRLVAKFYQGVAADPILRPMYPDEDLAEAQERLFLFLQQYWGGPNTYQQLRGHPRLRMRHSPFHVGIAAHDAWLGHMREAVDSLNLAPELAGELWSYLVAAADAMVNVED